jgi:hypothetical protein
MLKEPLAARLVNIPSYNDFCTNDKDIKSIGHDISNKVITRHPILTMMDVTKGDGDW